MPYTIPEYIEVKTATGNTVAFLSPESDGVVAWIDDEQNGSCTIEIELPTANEKWQYLTDKYRIYADGKEFVILNPDAVDKQRDGKKLKGKIKAHESWVLLGKKFPTISNDPQNPNPPWGAVIIVSGGAAHGGFDPGSAGSALSYLLNGTGWTAGTVDVTGTFDLETEKESVLYNINQVQEKWGGILIWDSVNKTVSLRDEATYQPYTGYRIRYAKNLKGISRVDDYDIVTRLYPFGENDLNIANVNGGLLYLDNQSYSTEVLEGVWYNQDLADQTQLKAQAEKQLAVMCKPRHNYKTDVLDLRSLPGYGHETFARSDMVDLLDEDFGANARVRIIRYRHNVFQPWLCDMELGDPLEKIAASVAQTVLMAKFYKNVVTPNTSFQNLLKAIINTEATEINGASGDYTLVDGVSTWFDRDEVTGELTGKLLRITPQGLIISYDGGQTWKLAISGEGFHADAGWVGKLNAGVVTVGAETTFADGYDPTKITADSVGMGVDADCVGLWHFDGSLNSHKGVAVDSDGAFDAGCFGQALNIVTDKYLKVPTTGMESSTGTINFRAKTLSASANGSVLVDLPKSDNAQGLQVGIANDGSLYISDSVKVSKTYTETTQADFQTGTLTNVAATSAGDLELVKDIDSYTKLLLHMDGSDNGTTFKDECGKTVTRYGAVTKTGVKKFGTASAYFDGTDDYLSVPDSADWSFGTGDFTIDCWVYVQSNTVLLGNITTPNNGWYVFVVNGKLGFYDSVTGVTREGASVSLNTWHHIAVVRYGNRFNLYLDGVSGYQVDNYSPDLSMHHKLTIGRPYENYDGYYYQGFIDELRISKGIARWTSDFTPPSAPYGDDYKTAGTRIKEVDISGAVATGGTKIEWSKTTPANTAVKVETALSTDGGSTYGAYQEATSGSSIPGIAAGTNLSNARLKIRETLSTTDTSVTPKLHSLTFTIWEKQATVAYGPNKSTLAGWDSISLAWEPERLSLVVNDSEAAYIENPGLPTAFGSNLFIGTDRNSANAINALVDELRIDKVYRDVAIRTGWHKTGVPFYTSEDMKQWPGYLKAETDGLKVYDSEGNLRVHLGSWFIDALREYGILIIEGKVYGSYIKTGLPGDTANYIELLSEFPQGGIMRIWGPDGNKAIEMSSSNATGTIELFEGGEIKGVLRVEPSPTHEIGLNSWDSNNGIIMRCYGTGESISIGPTGGQASQRGIDLYGNTGGIKLRGGSGDVDIESHYRTQITGDLLVVGTMSATGDKPAVQVTKNYGLRYLYATEAPEIIYYDRGVINLTDGEATVYLDPIYLECIEPHTELTPWQIWVQCYGENDVYVSEIGIDYFKIKERNDGKSNNRVVWKHEAIRNGYAGIRLMEVTN